jgi:succinylarginine dihydrolase
VRTFTDEQLEASPTLKRLSVLSRVNPFDVNDHIEVNKALAEALVLLIDALDRNAIQFNDRADKNALWQLLFVSYQLLTQIRPASPVRH